MTYMYIGPDLKGIVRHNQVFTYKPDEVIGKACEQNKLTKHLFIQMENIVESKNELRRPGSFLSIAYEKVEKTRR